MSRDYFVYGGESSVAFGVWVYDVDTDGAAARDYEEQIIPGANGVFLLDGKRYSNRAHLYTAVIFENTEANLAAFRAFLASQVGYKRLEDTLHPNEFYLAAYRNEIDPVIEEGRGALKITVEFDRKPERFLKAGETVTTLTANGTINNPTRFSSRPLLRVYGKGALGIGSDTITITAANSYTDIDCGIREAYKGTTSCNGNIQLSGTDFPELKPGSNTISLGTGITKVEITPRWYTL